MSINLNKFVKHIASPIIIGVILLIMISIFGSKNESENIQKPGVIYLGINAETDMEVEFISDTTISTSQQLSTPIPGKENRILGHSFNFHDNHLSINFIRLKSFHLNSFQLIYDDFYKTINTDNILQYFNLKNISFDKEGNARIIDETKKSSISFKNNDLFLSEYRTAHDEINKHYNLYKWIALFIFVIILVVLLIFFKANTCFNFQLKFIATNVILGFITLYSLNYIKDAPSGGTFNIHTTTSFTDTLNYSCLLSGNGIFEQERNTTKHITPVTTYKLSTNDNFIRISLPSNQSFDFSKIDFKKGLKTIELNKDEVISSFTLLNDVVVSDGKFKTGKVDPYIILNNQGVNFKNLKENSVLFHYDTFLVFLFILIFGFLYIKFPLVNPSNFIFSRLFLLFLFIVPFSTFFNTDKIVLKSEKRKAVQFPDKNTQLGEIPTVFDKYVNDQFAGRPRLITWHSLIKTAVIQDDKAVTPTLIGENDWMYYNMDNIEEFYLNNNPLSDEELKTMCHVLQERTDWLKLYDIDYYITFPPLKHNVYSEFIPEKLKKRKKNKETKLDQLIKYLGKHSTVKVIDLREMLMTKKKTEEVYHKFDTHWNQIGAFYSYQTIISTINNDHTSVGAPTKKDDYEWGIMKTNDGDLALLMALEDKYIRTNHVPHAITPFASRDTISINYPTYNSINKVITKVNIDKSKPKVVINRDSYSNYLMPYFSEHFSRSVYLWTPLFQPDIIKYEKPDIVVSEMLERFIYDLKIPNPEIVQKELKKKK